MIESEKNMIRELALNGYTDPQIAEIMNYSRAHIGMIRRQIGVKAKRGRPYIIPMESVTKMRELREIGMSYKCIGERLNISRYTVYDCIKRGGQQK